jgi:polar amino acid transport system permease protein
MTWDAAVIITNLPTLISGLLVTISLTLLTITLGTIAGGLAAFGTLMKSPIRYLAFVYIEFFLSMPALVLLIWMYYVLPFFSSFLVWSGFSVAVLGLSLSLSAFVAEIVRAGIASVSRGQLETALILGIPRVSAWMHIVLPQAVRTMWPALLGQFITTYKFSTLASVVTVGELLHNGELVIAQSYRPIEIYSVIAIFFVATIVPLNFLSRKLSKLSPTGIVSL